MYVFFYSTYTLTGPSIFGIYIYQPLFSKRHDNNLKLTTQKNCEIFTSNKQEKKICWWSRQLHWKQPLVYTNVAPTNSSVFPIFLWNWGFLQQKTSWLSVFVSFKSFFRVGKQTVCQVQLRVDGIISCRFDVTWDGWNHVETSKFLYQLLGNPLEWTTQRTHPQTYPAQKSSLHKRRFESIASLKKNSSPLKMDGWKTSLSFWGKTTYFQATKLSFREAIDLTYCFLHQPSIQGTWFKGKHGHKKLSKLNNDQVTTNLKLKWIKLSLKKQVVFHLFGWVDFCWREGWRYLKFLWEVQAVNIFVQQRHCQIVAPLQTMELWGKKLRNGFLPSTWTKETQDSRRNGQVEEVHEWNSWNKISGNKNVPTKR